MPTPVCIILIYVDDGLICFSRGTNIDHILDTMDKAFSNTRGPAGCYVGLCITRRRDTQEIFLDQTHYLTKLVRKFGFLDVVPLSVPADPHSHLSFLSSDDFSSTTNFPYQTIVGCLQFACIGTRPNISYAVSVAAKYCLNPSPAHCNALRRILKYLAGTLDLGLSFSGNNHPLSLLIEMLILPWILTIKNHALDTFFLSITVMFFGPPANRQAVPAALLKQNT
jgi:hypothetical protein